MRLQHKGLCHYVLASSRLVTADLRDAFTPDVCFVGTGQVRPRVRLRDRLGPILKTISINLPVDTSSGSSGGAEHSV